MEVWRNRRIGVVSVWLGAGGVVATVLSLTAPSARSVSVGWSEPVIAVEEDWVLVLNEPDDHLYSPQFHTVMFPTTDVDGHYAQVLWNYRETPDFTAGGIQLQSYEGEELLRVRSVESRTLSSSAETITWTQGLVTDGAVLTFYIDHGTSTTWGSFGRDMRIDEAASISNLDHYSSDTSAENCMITFGTNRVESLILAQVRRYGASGLLSVDTTPRVVYQYGDDFD